MKKQVNVALTILITYYPKDLELPDDASNDELHSATDEIVTNIIAEIQSATGLVVNEIETEICG